MGSVERKYFNTKKGTGLIIRNGRFSDAEEIIALNKSVLDEQIFMMREHDEAKYNPQNFGNEIESYLHSPNHIYLVAEVENKIVGYIEFRNGSLKRTAHSGMFSMFILKEFREDGIGKLLLDSLIDWAEKNPVIEKLTLAVFSTNERAQQLYKKCGFIEEGRCPKDLKLKDGTYIDSVLMYKFVK